jgi:N-acylneuraminate cytidylyltransferase/CMP-N,N'-diacetyllegionaminic acid synthase
MGDSMKRLCTICARGGSKGIKGKNLLPLNGIPLLVHSLNHAKDTHLFDVIAVSSDSEDILQVASDWGCEFLIQRPSDLASDEAAKLPAIRHCVSEVERLTGTSFDTLVDLDATSPLRNCDDIRGAVALVENNKAGNVITVTRARHSPYFNMIEVDENNVLKLCKQTTQAIKRRQDAPECFDMNASIYVWSHESLFGRKTLFNADTRAHVMPEERSVDIDSELDFLFVEFLMKRKRSK